MRQAHLADTIPQNGRVSQLARQRRQEEPGGARCSLRVTFSSFRWESGYFCMLRVSVLVGLTAQYWRDPLLVGRRKRNRSASRQGPEPREELGAPSQEGNNSRLKTRLAGPLSGSP